MADFLKPFAASRLRIARAITHIEEMKALQHQYSINAAVSLIKGPPDASGLYSVTARCDKPPPEMTALVLSDAMHNVTMALDLMICDIAILLGKSRAGIAFPFAKDQQELNLKLLKQPLKGLGSAICEAIKETQPYRGGSVLYELNNFDNLYKHRMIVPVGGGQARLMPERLHAVIKSIQGRYVQNYFVFTENVGNKVPQGFCTLLHSRPHISRASASPAALGHAVPSAGRW